MRVYEFAKLHDVKSKQVLDKLKKDFNVTSHMSILSQNEVDFLEKIFQTKKALSSEKKEVKQPQRQVKKVEKANYKKNNSKSFARKKEEKKSSFQVEEKKDIILPLLIEPMTLADFSLKTNVPVSQVILSLLKEGKVCAINQELNLEDVKKLADIYAIPVEEKIVKTPSENNKISLSEKNTTKRHPVIVVMGHVDHGKTTLLDYVRRTRVASREKGGITQHLGAYEVASGHGNLVFLDTPGHEAFSKIRKRGASVADIAILVIAADDGVMPQTLESIKAIKALDIPVIVAINKVDKVNEQRLEIVKRQLTQHNLLPEEWGGDVVCVPISGKTGKGVDELLEIVALQSEMMELKASLVAQVKGYILEAKMLKGRGAVATVLSQQGVLHVGDFVKAGNVVGKVTTITNSDQKLIKSVGPSIPVQITGFSSMPEVGDVFEGIDQAEYKLLKSDLTKLTHSTFSATSNSGDNSQKINIIVKADTQSSLEAIFDAIKKFPSKTTKNIIVVRSGVGTITESDVLLAESTKSLILGFNVKVEHNASVCARQTKIDLQLYDVIYKLLEELETSAVKAIFVKTVLTKIGQATVLKVFNVKKIGVIAGCIVNDGKFVKKAVVAAIRKNQEYARGSIKSLQREKKSVKEVNTGFECGFVIEGIEDWQEGDIAECYVEMPA